MANGEKECELDTGLLLEAGNEQGRALYLGGWLLALALGLRLRASLGLVDSPSKSKTQFTDAAAATTATTKIKDNKHALA